MEEPSEALFWRIVSIGCMGMLHERWTERCSVGHHHNEDVKLIAE